MTQSRLATGRAGEAIVVDLVRRWGWRVRETNWRCRMGEIDLVAEDGPCLVIVEVRTRRAARAGQAASYGSPEASVGRAKRRKLVRLGYAYVQQTGWSGPWRIDVVAVILGPDDRAARLTHYPNAVSEA